MNTINRVLAITWPDTVTESHRARIEVKALNVPARYAFSEFKSEANEGTGLFGLVPNNERDVHVNPFGYEVDMQAQPTPTCTCPGFKGAGICSHVVAVADFIHLNAWADDMDATMADFIDDQAGRHADLAERFALS